MNPIVSTRRDRRDSRNEDVNQRLAKSREAVDLRRALEATECPTCRAELRASLAELEVR